MNWEGKMEEQNSELPVVDRNKWETMTDKEQEKYLDDLLKRGKNFTLNGVRYIFDQNIGPISWSHG
jgi:hypothetical protein